MFASLQPVAFLLATDAARARSFYGDTLGLPFLSQDEHAVVFAVNGARLRVTLMPSFTPSEHTVFGWNVPDIEQAVADLAVAGIAVERYSFLPQDERGIWTSPDGAAKVAWFKDPDGNVLSVSQL